MRVRLIAASIGISVGIVLSPRVSEAQAAPTPSDSLIGVQLEVVPFPVFPRGSWTLTPETGRSLPPRVTASVPSKNCPMPVATGDSSGDAASKVRIPTGTGKSAPTAMPTQRSTCSNPLGPERTP